MNESNATKSERDEKGTPSSTDSTFEPLDGLDTEQIDSVLLYICDSLRWDARPGTLTGEGVTLRTAVHGLSTPPGITSIVTGLYPPRHGVSQFENRIPPDIDSLFDTAGWDSYFNHNQWKQHPIFGLLGQSPAPSLEEVEPPFIYVEHDHGAHAPYPALDMDVRETFRSLSRNEARLLENYQEGVDASVDRFESRLETLTEKGLEDRTLVIFTSDHGELLGEHGGFVGHTLPATPELVYVPTIIQHPSLQTAEYANDLIQQVDLLPTIRAVLDEQHDVGSFDGESLLESVSTGRVAYNEGAVEIFQDRRLGRHVNPVYHTLSAWTAMGGHVFPRTATVKRVLTGVYDSLFSAETASYNASRGLVRTLRELLPMYLDATPSFGRPELTRSEASDFCESIYRLGTTQERGREVSEETEQLLRDLGYR